MKRLVAALAILILLLPPLPAAAQIRDIPLFGGPQDPSQLQVYLNTIIKYINTQLIPDIAAFALPHVADNAALKLTSTTTGAPFGVQRDDFAAGIGAPPMWFVPQFNTCAHNNYPGTSTPEVSDGIYCQDTAASVGDGNSWVAKLPSTGIDWRQGGASPSATGAANTATLQAAENAAYYLGTPVQVAGYTAFPMGGTVYTFPGSKTIFPQNPAPQGGNSGACLTKNFTGAMFASASTPGTTFPIYPGNHVWWGGSLPLSEFDNVCIDMAYNQGAGIAPSALQVSRIVQPNIFNIPPETTTGAQTWTGTGSISGTTFTAATSSAGDLRPGDTLIGAQAGTFITGVLSSTYGTTGTYSVSISQTTSGITGANRPGTWSYTNDQGAGYLPNGGIVFAGGGTVNNNENIEVIGGIVGNANTYHYDTPFDWSQCTNMGANGIVLTSVKQIGSLGNSLPPNADHIENVSVLCNKVGIRNDYGGDTQISNNTDMSWSGRVGYQGGTYGYLENLVGGSVSGGGGDTLCGNFSAETLTNSPKLAICYTTIGGDTTTTAAQGLAKAINGSADLRAYGISAIVPTGTSGVNLYYGEVQLGSATVTTGGAGCTNGSQTFTLSGGIYGVAATVTGTVTGNVLGGALSVANAGSYFDMPVGPVTVTGGGCVTPPTIATVAARHPLNINLYTTGALTVAQSRAAASQDITDIQEEVPRYAGFFFGANFRNAIIRNPGFHINTPPGRPAAPEIEMILADHADASGAANIFVEYADTGQSSGTYETSDFTASLSDPQPYRVCTNGGIVHVTLPGWAPWSTKFSFLDYCSSWGFHPIEISAPSAKWNGPGTSASSIKVLGQATVAYQQFYGRVDLSNDQGTWDGTPTETWQGIGPINTKWYPPDKAATTGGTAVVVADTAYCLPLIVSVPKTILKFGTHSTATGTGTSAKYGLYMNDPVLNRPSILIGQTPATGVPDGNGNLIASLSPGYDANAGAYWQCSVWTFSAAPTLLDLTTTGASGGPLWSASMMGGATVGAALGNADIGVTYTTAGLYTSGFPANLSGLTTDAGNSANIPAMAWQPQ